MNIELLVFGIIFVIFVELSYWGYFRGKEDSFFIEKTISLFLSMIMIGVSKIIYEVYKLLDFDNPNVMYGFFIFLGVIGLYLINYVINYVVDEYKNRRWR